MKIPKIVLAALLISALAGMSWHWYYATANAPPPAPSRPSAVSVQHPTTYATPGPTPQTATLPDDNAEVPRRFQIPGVERVKTANNFKDWLAQFPPSDQDLLVGFDKSHFGLYSTITSRGQVSWMAAHGYPMPEDVIAAKNLSDADLRSLAESGNDKAGFLLHERQAAALQARVAAYTAGGGTKEELFRSDQNLALEESKINDLIQALYANSNSPYKGYAMAQDAIQISDPDDRASRIITGLLWAAEYGDSRASTDSLSKALTGDVLGGKRMEAQLLAAQQMLLILKKDRRFGCSPVQGTPISEKTW